MQYVEIIIPTFDKYNDIRVLDAFINEKPEYFFEVRRLIPEGTLFKKMIIAKLAGNKDYELVCDAMKQFIANAEGKQSKTSIEKYNSVYERMYERLKSVAPLNISIMD